MKEYNLPISFWFTDIARTIFFVFGFHLARCVLLKSVFAQAFEKELSKKSIRIQLSQITIDIMPFGAAMLFHRYIAGCTGLYWCSRCAKCRDYQLILVLESVGLDPAITINRS